MSRLAPYARAWSRRSPRPAAPGCSASAGPARGVRGRVIMSAVGAAARGRTRPIGRDRINASRRATYTTAERARGTHHNLPRSRSELPRRVRHRQDAFTLCLRRTYAEALYADARASRADILQAVAILGDVTRASRRVLGANHPDTVETLTELERARMKREDVAAP